MSVEAYLLSYKKLKFALDKVKCSVTTDRVVLSSFIT